MSHDDRIYHSGGAPGCSEPGCCCFCLCGQCKTCMKDPADKWSGSIQSEMMPEGSFEVKGKTYKFLYKQRMYGKIARFVAVLGVWNEESCRFEINDMADEVISAFDSDCDSWNRGFKVAEKIREDQKAKECIKRPRNAKGQFIATVSKKGQVCENDALGFKVVKKMMARGFKAPQKILK